MATEDLERTGRRSPDFSRPRAGTYISQRMRWLALALVVACGGKQVIPEPEKPLPPAVVKPSCAPAGKIELPADGLLSCRELPITIAFPPGTQLTRQNDRALTLYSAKLEKGVMALVAEPRTDAVDGPSIEALLKTLIAGVALDAATTSVTAPALAGTSASAAVTFTTPDGGAGVAHGYFANHWLFAVLAGARSKDSPARADTPAAQAFLASLALAPIAEGKQTHALVGGGSVELPASAWSTGTQPPQDGVRAEVIFLAPDRGAWLGVRELEPKDYCTLLKADTDAQLAERLTKMYSNAQNPLGKIERAKFGDVAVYAEAASEPRHVVMYLICSGKSVVQLSAAGERPFAELRGHLDELAKSLVGAK